MFFWFLQLRRGRAGKVRNLAWMLLCSRRSATRADYSGIDKPEVVAQAPALRQVIQQVGKDIGPSAIAAPATEAAIDGLPRAEVVRDVAPGSAGVKTPKDAIENAVVILKRASAMSAVNSMREER